MHFGIKDLIGILLMALLLYQTYKLMKNSGTLAIFSGVVLFVVVWILISQVLEMWLMGVILDKFISIGFVVSVILFQDKIHRFLLALGSYRGRKFLGKLFFKRGDDPEKEGEFVAPVVLACMNMARKETGALIVIQQDMGLIICRHTDEMFNADVSARSIGNIFSKSSPLHDGVMIIADNRIKAVGYTLPIAQNATFPKDAGLRHRSGLGISLETDALVIIISEERGKISVAHRGKLSVDVTAGELQQILSGERGVTDYC